MGLRNTADRRELASKIWEIYENRYLIQNAHKLETELSPDSEEKRKLSDIIKFQKENQDIYEAISGAFTVESPRSAAFGSPKQDRDVVILSKKEAVWRRKHFIGTEEVK